MIKVPLPKQNKIKILIFGTQILILMIERPLASENVQARTPTILRLEIRPETL